MPQQERHWKEPTKKILTAEPSGSSSQDKLLEVTNHKAMELLTPYLLATSASELNNGQLKNSLKDVEQLQV